MVQHISLLERNGNSWSNVTNLLIDVIANNTILTAESEDLNQNGYIDSYLLSFATGSVSASALSGVTVAGVARL